MVGGYEKDGRNMHMKETCNSHKKSKKTLKTLDKGFGTNQLLFIFLEYKYINKFY